MKISIRQPKFSNMCSSLKSSVVVMSLVMTLAVGSVFAADQDDAAWLGKLKDSKHSLADGIAQSEKENGVGISAKFEIKGETLMLSVYTAKEGLGKDAEHNALIELQGDAAKSPWTPEIEVFEDKKHLTRAAMQLTLVQLSKLTLADAIKKAEAAQPGTVYSVIPAVKDGAPVFDVKVATADGKSVHLTVDGKTGKASK
jgi:uncharacterized membrane protein YkoI